MYNIFNYFKNPFSTSFYCFFAKKRKQKHLESSELCLQSICVLLIICIISSIFVTHLLDFTKVVFHLNLDSVSIMVIQSHSVWKSQKKSNSTLWATQATLKTFVKLKGNLQSFPKFSPFVTFFSSIFVQDLFGYTVSRQ